MNSGLAFMIISIFLEKSSDRINLAKIDNKLEFSNRKATIIKKNLTILTLLYR